MNRVGVVMAIGWLCSAGCAARAHTLATPALTSVSPRPAASLPQPDGSSYLVRPGDTLWGIAHDFGWSTHELARVNRLSVSNPLKVGQTIYVPTPPESSRFVWPVRSQGARPDAQGRSVRIGAPEGSIVRAAKTGRVAVAAADLEGFGKTVLLDHGDGYVSIYAGLDQMLVAPGMTVQQGKPLGRLGRDPLYFEIRYGTHAYDIRKLLP